MSARLIIMTGKHQGKKMALTEGCKLVVGRDEGVAVRLATSEVSRRHCAIRLREGVASVEDLGSRNGTWADGERIDRFLADQFAYFLGRLREVREGDDTLLDQCMVMYGSGIGDGNRHNHDELHSCSLKYSKLPFPFQVSS